MLNISSMLRTSVAAIGILCALLVALGQIALGQTYPSQRIEWIVPYAAGGASDAFARPTAQRVSELLGHPVIVMNMPGANSIIGTNHVAKSPPDGYKILQTSNIHYLVPMFSKNLPYDAYKDFTPIIILCTAANILAVHPSLPVRSIQDLIEYGKKNLEKPLHYGTSGAGSTQHLAGILFGQKTGLNVEHVPYKGGGQTVVDALSGTIPMVILTASVIMPLAKEGKLRPLGIIEAKRDPGAPNVPTIGETVPDYAVPETWLGVVGPAGMPRQIVGRLNTEIRKAITAPETRTRLESLGFRVTGSTPEEFEESIRKDIPVFQRIITSAGIEPQ
jgi:tripartite-type tricarboxylate transporter receptor subunit TctC